MPIPKSGQAQNGKPMHYSVSAIISRDNENRREYLLIDRAIPPYGFAGPAGHIDQGESEIEALVREVEEETGLKVEKHKLLLEEELNWNWCSKGMRIHYWYVFECVVSGEIKRNVRETKSIGWYSAEEIKKLELEPVWEYWFKKTKIISSKSSSPPS